MLIILHINKLMLHTCLSSPLGGGIVASIVTTVIHPNTTSVFVHRVKDFGHSCQLDNLSLFV